MYHIPAPQFNLKAHSHLARLGMLLITLIAAGCAGNRGKQIETFIPEGVPVPTINDTLADLEANDRAIRSFRCSGTTLLESPNFDARRKFRAVLRFQRPHRLYVEGRDRLANITVFRLISLEEEFLMEFPRNKDESFYQLEGEEFEDVPFSVSPAVIVKEMFLPEEWAEVKRRQLHLIDYIEDEHRLIAEIRYGRKLHRRVEMQQVDPESPRWVITRHVRFDEYGNILAITELDDFSKVEDALFPGRVDAYFPTEDTRMTFTMRNIELNAEIEDDVYDIRTRALELNLAERRSGEGV